MNIYTHEPVPFNDEWYESMNSAKLRSWREYYDVTQDVLADMLGVGRSRIGAWEAADRHGASRPWHPLMLGRALRDCARELGSSQIGCAPTSD